MLVEALRRERGLHRRGTVAEWSDFEGKLIANAIVSLLSGTLGSPHLPATAMGASCD